MLSTANLRKIALLSLWVGAVQVGQNAHVTVDSSELEPLSIDKKTDPAEKPIIYSDGSTSVGFNDDAEPNLSTRF